MNINEIINDIVGRVNKDWSTLTKIRFAYVELGKCLQKNTDFFFSVDNKLQDNNLSFDEIESIYNEEVVLSTEVICRSSSILLKAILDRLGIESKLVKSINNVMEYSDGDRDLIINHWMLVVSDGEKEYFCTLSSDLPYIQMGMETKHFGVNIPYVKELNDGTSIHVYEGEEIKHSVLSREQLKEIDVEICYIRDYYRYDESNQASKDWNLQYSNASLNMLRDAVRGNKLFNEIEISRSDFIKETFEFEGHGGRHISLYDGSIKSLSSEDWQIWIKIVCKNVLKKICEIIGYEIYPIPPIDSKDWNYDSWLLSLCCMIEDEVYSRLDVKNYDSLDGMSIDVTNFKYNKWSKKVKNTFIFDKDYECENIVLLLDKMNAIVNYVNGKNKNGSLNSLFNSISHHFINSEHTYINNIEEDGKLSNDYIAYKFSLMFDRVFSCSEGRTDFNNMSYSEQVVIIKEVLGIMFPEITYENSGMVSDYDNRFSPVLNRIQVFPVKENSTGEYAIVFGILGEEEKEENEYYFFYDLKSNKFEVCDILNVYQNYTIVSNRMKNRFSVEDLENLESQRKK